MCLLASVACQYVRIVAVENEVKSVYTTYVRRRRRERRGEREGVRERKRR